MNDVLTVREAATIARTGESTIRLACHSGALPAFDKGTTETRRYFRIRRADLDAWVAANYPTEKEAER